MENVKKSLFVFWIFFLLFNFIAWYAFYVGRIKEFFIKLVIVQCIFTTFFVQIIVMIINGSFWVTRGDSKALLFDFHMKSRPEDFFVYYLAPTIYNILVFILTVWAIIDFFRIITGKYIPKDLQIS